MVRSWKVRRRTCRYTDGWSRWNCWEWPRAAGWWHGTSLREFNHITKMSPNMLTFESTS